MILPRRDFLFTAVFRRRERPDQILARFGKRPSGSALSVEQLLWDAENRDYLMWAFVVHRDSLPGRSSDLCRDTLQDTVARRMSRWNPNLRRLVVESDSATVEQFPFTAAERVAPWTTTNVTLLGDAIHGMPPVGGLGGNTALRDAALLCRALTAADRGESSLLTAIAKYEADMLTYGFAAVREATRYLRLAISPSVTLRRTARGFFRLCGALPPLRRAVFSDA
jgi:2-polyprenyl-6-methoxyphenol hydroxylase-like FAD-dependent oxidoreductase